MFLSKSLLKLRYWKVISIFNVDGLEVSLSCISISMNSWFQEKHSRENDGPLEMEVRG